MAQLGLLGRELICVVYGQAIDDVHVLLVANDAGFVFTHHRLTIGRRKVLVLQLSLLRLLLLQLLSLLSDLRLHLGLLSISCRGVDTLVSGCGQLGLLSRELGLLSLELLLHLHLHLLHLGGLGLGLSQFLGESSVLLLEFRLGRGELLRALWHEC